MKAFLVFNKIGEITELNSKSNTFDIVNFPDYKHYKRYDEYVILYNIGNPDTKNPTVFNFTKDTFTSDIALLKLNKDDSIRNLTYKSYIKIMSKIKIEENDIIYSSDEQLDILDVTPFTYKK